GADAAAARGRGPADGPGAGRAAGGGRPGPRPGADAVELAAARGPAGATRPRPRKGVQGMAPLPTRLTTAGPAHPLQRVGWGTLTLCLLLNAGCALTSPFAAPGDGPKPGATCQVLTTWSNQVNYTPDPTHGGVPTPGLA